MSALAARTTLATPFRRARLRHLAAKSMSPLSVLFYHRVANHHPNDWTLSKQKFLQHIEYCQSHCDMIDLAELQRRVNEGDSQRPSASITFDDGYQDNFDFALPFLIERKIPCTYFVTTTNIVHQSPFRHDVMAGQPLPVNTVKQIRQLSDAGIEIGCHTRNHVDFAKVYDPQVVRKEIIDAKEELQQIIGKAVRYFAFPFGLPRQLTQAAIEAVSEAGFDGFCSAFGGYNLVGHDAFHIRRFHGDPEYARFKNWVSYDPRKQRRAPQIRYFLPDRIVDPSGDITDSSLVDHPPGPN